MPWLEYRATAPHHVIEIHAERPATIREDYALAESDAFKPGDEAEYYIHVNKVADGRVTSHAAVRQGPSVRLTLERLTELETATGIGGNPGEHSIAKRVDAIEARISALEVKVR